MVDTKTIDKNKKIHVISDIEDYSFLFRYLFFLDEELQILSDKKYIFDIKKYENMQVKYDDITMYNKISNLIQV